MKRILILLAFCTAFSLNTQAQKASDVAFKDRLWYGAHANFGLSNSSNQFFSNQFYFAIGVSPMVGYKITPSLSVGPRAKILYNNYRFRDHFDNVASFNPITWDIGVFSRMRIYEGFFVQGEYGYEDSAYIPRNLNEGIIRVSGANAYIGAGLNRQASGRIGYEFMLTYNLDLIGSRPLNPITLRAGLTIGLF